MVLGKNIFIPSNVKLYDAPKKREFIEKHFEVVVGIDQDHTASFVISESDFKALSMQKEDILVVSE